MPDLTSTDGFFDFLSSFWSQVYGDSLVPQGLCAALSHRLLQLYRGFAESAASMSIKTLKPLRTELALPLVIRLSEIADGPDRLKFGEGAAFGPQPPNTAFADGQTFDYGGLERRSGFHYVQLPEGAANVLGAVVNRLFDPSVVWVRDNDFVVSGGFIGFRQNPFDNPLIPQRVTPGLGGGDRQIVLWALDAQIDAQDLHETYGFLIGSTTASDESARLAVECVFRAWNEGPTLAALDSLVAGLAGAPMIREPLETVASVEDFGGQTVVVTDLSVYVLAPGLRLRPEITVGRKLAAGSPLSDVTQVFDRNSGDWWKALPGLALGSDFLAVDIRPVTFLNETFQAEAREEGGQTFARFHLAGRPQDVEAFWAQSEARGSLAPALWKAAGAAPFGIPDYSAPVFVNPLELLISQLGDQLLAVQIDAQNVPKPRQLFSGLGELRRAAPAACGLLVVVASQLEDECLLGRTDGVWPESLALNPTADVITANGPALGSLWTDSDSQGPLTLCPEALAIDDSPEIATDIFDTQSGEEQFNIKMEEVCAQ